MTSAGCPLLITWLTVMVVLFQGVELFRNENVCLPPFFLCCCDDVCGFDDDWLVQSVPSITTAVYSTFCGVCIDVRVQQKC